MKTRRWLGVILSACAVAMMGAHEASAICGNVNVYSVSTPAAPTGVAILYSPIAPFPVTGMAFIPLGGVFGDAAYETIISAGMPVPPKFMRIVGPPPCGPCVVAPAAVVFSLCVAPTFVGVYN